MKANFHPMLQKPYKHVAVLSTSAKMKGYIWIGKKAKIDRKWTKIKKISV